MSFFATRRGKHPPSSISNSDRIVKPLASTMTTTTTTSKSAAQGNASMKLVTLTRKITQSSTSLKEREAFAKVKRERDQEQEFTLEKQRLKEEREYREGKRIRIDKGKDTPRTAHAKVEVMDSDEDSEDEEELGTPVDTRKRPLKILRENIAASLDANLETLNVIAGERVVRENLSAYVQYFPDLPEETVANMEYPGDDARETFLLLRPRARDQQDYHPIQDIIATIRVICDYFLTPEQAMDHFKHIPHQSSSALGSFDFLSVPSNPTSTLSREPTPLSELGTPEPPSSNSLCLGDPAVASSSTPATSQNLMRLLEKAYRRKNGQAFLEALSVYNTNLSILKAKGAIRENIISLGQTQGIPEAVWQRITGQSYERTVGPRVEELKKYEAFSDNTYGELLPPFVSHIAGLTGLGPESTMIDMGSGVGNCCVQASLATGCISYGFENQRAAASIANLQVKEAAARARLWGISCGTCQCHEADFLASSSLVSAALREADVVLINNYVFSPETNESLSLMFLDLKDGAKVVSLKPFVHTSGETAITSRNVGSPANILVQSKPIRFDRGCVSWSAEGGIFYIAEVNRNRLKEYLEEVGQM